MTAGFVATQTTFLTHAVHANSRLIQEVVSNTVFTESFVALVAVVSVEKLAPFAYGVVKFGRERHVAVLALVALVGRSAGLALDAQKREAVGAHIVAVIVGVYFAVR